MPAALIFEKKTRLLCGRVERSDNGVHLIAKLCEGRGEHAAGLHARLTLCDGIQAGGDHAAIHKAGACTVDVGGNGVDALQRIHVTAHRGKERHRVCAAGLCEPVYGALRLGRFAQRACHERFARSVAHAADAGKGNAHADQRDDENEYDDGQQTDQMLVFSSARIGLK